MKNLKEHLTSQGVKYILPSYVDMHGASKSKMVPIAHFDRMMNGSELCTGAALDGIPQDISDEEVASHPDANSCVIQPWQPDVAWMASDLWCEGKPFEPCSRNILKRVLKQADDLGYGLNLGIEAEFFALKHDQQTGQVVPLSNRPHLQKPAYDVPRLSDNLFWLDELVSSMNTLDWDVYSFDHEDGIGQFEIDFDYSDALTMSDRYVFFRRMANEITRKHGGFASFMPKPYPNFAGSGAHFNLSLFDKISGANLFETDNDPRGCGISQLGYQFLAGILKNLPAISAVVAPTVNSYKRLILKGSTSGFTWAPVYCSYGNNNRTNTLRIPRGGGRVELRLADPMCNPYLSSALVLAAGLQGIEDGLDPGEPHLENLYTKSQQELDDLGVKWLPRTLIEAVDAFAENPLAKTVFGEAMFDSWIQFKRDEWFSYLNHVSEWERDRYLTFY